MSLKRTLGNAIESKITPQVHLNTANKMRKQKVKKNHHYNSSQCSQFQWVLGHSYHLFWNLPSTISTSQTQFHYKAFPRSHQANTWRKTKECSHTTKFENISSHMTLTHTHDITLRHGRSRWLSGRTPDCGARGPRFESHRGRSCLSRQSLQYTALGTGCAPLLQCLGRLSLPPSVGR